MSSGLLIVYFVVVLGLVFEFLNGFHDSANAIATVVATRVLSPLAAVLMAGVLNLVGALSGTAVAVTLGKGIIDPSVVDMAVIIGVLSYENTLGVGITVDVDVVPDADVLAEGFDLAARDIIDAMRAGSLVES